MSAAPAEAGARTYGTTLGALLDGIARRRATSP